MSFANLPVVCHLMKGGNPDIRLEDISTLLLREYLVKVGSKLASEINIRPLQEILEQMDLFVEPKENRMLRNVAAMMFCENPSKFFKRTQVEIVYFPEGRLNNPSNLYEGAVITGSVPQIIDRTLEYLKRMLVMQSIIKPENDYRSRKFYTYPYQALEESVTNSLYHRDYREWEPVVITVEPDSITIQKCGYRIEVYLPLTFPVVRFLSQNVTATVAWVNILKNWT